jgi:MFS family permease
VSNIKLAAIIGQPSLINFFSSFTSGIITVALPAIARSLEIPASLYLWPSSVYGLTSGSMLLIAGAIADVIGPRRVELVGCLLLGAFTLASGFSQNGIQMVVFRALQGIAMAMHLPASVSLVAAGVPEGRLRNFGFACLGLSQLMGFSVGMVASGIMVDKVGWRSPFFLSATGVLLSSALAFYAAPKVKPEREEPVLQALMQKVDWVGGLLASGGLALLSYVLA